MKATKILNLIAWTVLATTAGYLLPQIVVNQGGSIPISPLNIIITLPLIGIILLLMAIPIFKYRKALLTKAKDLNAVRPLPLNPFYAVRILLLAKSISISGSIFSGWHIGVVWLQLSSPIIPSSIVQNAMALLGSIVMTICAVLVERFCRVIDDGPGSATDASPATGEPA